MHRWSIRTKLLLLLLGLALLPLMFVTWLDYQVMRKIGADLALQMRQALTERARQELVHSADQYAALVQHRTGLLELMVRQQAREVEARLLAEASAPGAPIVLDTDIDRGDPRVRLMPSAKYQRQGDAEADMTVDVTYDTQVFRLPRGSSADSHRAMLARLAGMTDAYRFLHQSHGGLLLWQYTTLESGLHCVYPGHGGYPEDYDPRERNWYRSQRETPDLIWHPPLIDVSTGQVVLTASMPVRAANGAFAGVTAIDIPLTSYLSDLPPQSSWAEQSRVYVVTPDDSEKGKGRLRVLARGGYETGGARWDAMAASEWLNPPAAAEPLLRDIAQRRSGIVEADHERENALWAYRPIGSSDAWLIVIVPSARTTAIAGMAYDAALMSTRGIVLSTLFVGLLLIAIALGAGWASAGAITRPVRDLADATRRVSGGDFEARTRIDTGDELQDLGEAFNTMVPLLKDRVRYAEGIRMAREVQQHLIPAHPPGSADLDIGGITIYCEETGGDYHDFLELGSPAGASIGIAIGDVSGHGISSALLMVTVRALLHSYARQSRSLAEIMTALNDRLTDDVHAGRFMTLLYLLVEPAARRLRWVSAGHDAALLFRPHTGVFHELTGHDIPLGVDANWVYNESVQEGWLAGDVVLMTTDGVWESRNANDEPFGKARLRDIVRNHATEPAQVICEAVTEAVRRYREQRSQSDDITVVALKALT